MQSNADNTDRQAGPAGDRDFGHWLTARSFSMLGPLCRIGLLVVLLMLLLVDPLLYRLGVWGELAQHRYLMAWHGCAALYFGSFLWLAQRRTTHGMRRRCLDAFLVLGATLFSWFGFISWSLSGDLSTYAIFLLTMVCVFGQPGRLRMALCLASCASLLLAIYWLDGRAVFYTSGAAMNLAALAAVTLLLDAHLMRLNHALYREKRQVEQERARADRVLYNALPVSIADELKTSHVVKAEKYPRMAVLFVDIVGFTDFAAVRPPDQVVLVLNEIFSVFDTLVDRHDVEKIKTIGDAYMVVGKGDPAAVASLALDMLAAMLAYRLRSGHVLALRGGMHVGATVAGVIGLKRFLYDVWGDAVNLASRMESTGQPGRIQVTTEVARMLGDRFLFSAPAVVEVKGKGPVRTRFLLARHGEPAAPARRTVRTSAATTAAGASSGTPSGRPGYADCAG